ncbi:MAG: hypothetical protein R3C53_01500 [Pirellulaceae bacterium]
MKTKLLGLTVLLLVAMSTFTAATPQAACTNVGCIEVDIMANVIGQGPATGCTVFDVTTGRTLRNTQGVQGGTPKKKNLPKQTATVYDDSCAECAAPAGSTQAIESTGTPPMMSNSTTVDYFQWECQ